MKQVLQNIKTGETELTEVPAPGVRNGGLLINSNSTLLSAGTERMLVEFGKAGWISKARSQPEKVRQVIDKIRTDGLFPTIDAVRSKLDQPLPLGYCNAGTVVKIGDGVESFSVGDRVVSNGSHAEIVCVPKNLCAKIPDNVSFEDAAFTVVSAIALQGIRLANPSLGEYFVVTGLGLIGLLAVQMLRANGCRVLGIDYDSSKCELARSFGASVVDLSKGEDPIAASALFSSGRGVDGVLITASTKSNEPVSQAATMCRKRGRIVLVGVAGLELSRSDFYEKELTFQVSCSYGPGRYDPSYEEKGCDYPLGYVRWTEQRNFEAVLGMMSSGILDVKPLISHRFKIENAVSAYSMLTGNDPYLGILLQYGPAEIKSENTVIPLHFSSERKPNKPIVGFIGAGNYAGRVLLPSFKRAGANFKTIVAAGGVSASYYGRKYNFSNASSNYQDVINDPDINVVVIATRHDSHARFVCDALSAGKHVFVEKPLALTFDELDKIEKLYNGLGVDAPLLMVGFNRRFSPHIKEMKRLISQKNSPKSFIVTVNAGFIPEDHWTQDKSVGGGRIIGEGCHFIDLLRFLAGAPITKVSINCMERKPGVVIRSDKVSITMNFLDGSFGTIHYLANGHKSFPKERIEVFCDGAILQLDNFRRMRGYGWKRFSKMNLWSQDKGQNSCVDAFLSAIGSGNQSPIPFNELIETGRITIEADAMLE